MIDILSPFAVVPMVYGMIAAIPILIYDQSARPVGRLVKAASCGATVALACAAILLFLLYVSP